MQDTRDGYLLTDDASALSIDAVERLLAQSYWAAHRPRKVIAQSIEHSMCFALSYGELQIGFARVVTDYATFGYLADVIVDQDHRGKGLGKWLVETMMNDPRGQDLFLMLATQDAHTLYEQYGFSKSDRLMCRRR